MGATALAELVIEVVEDKEWGVVEQRASQKQSCAVRWSERFAALAEQGLFTA